MCAIIVLYIHMVVDVYRNGPPDAGIKINKQHSNDLIFFFKPLTDEFQMARPRCRFKAFITGNNEVG